MKRLQFGPLIVFVFHSFLFSLNEFINSKSIIERCIECERASIKNKKNITQIKCAKQNPISTNKAVKKCRDSVYQKQ